MPLRHQPISLPVTDPDGSYDGSLVNSYRATCLTASDAPSLFSENPKLGYWELWQRKRTGIVPADNSPSNRTARAFKPVVAKLVAEQQGFAIERDHEFLVHPTNEKAGTRLPYSIAGGDPRVASDGPGVLEARFLQPFDFEQNWRSSQGALRPPAKEFIKQQAHYYVSGRSWGGIGIQVNGETHYFDIPRDDAFIAQLEARIFAFFKSVADGAEPIPDFRAEADAILARYVNTTTDKTVDDRAALADIGLVAQRIRELEAEKQALQPRLNAVDNDLKAEKARLAKLMGDAQFAEFDSYLVVKKTVERKPYTVNGTSYPTFTIKEKDTQQLPLQQVPLGNAA